MKRSWISSLLCSTALLLGSSSLLAATITIDVADYTGQVRSSAGYKVGTHTGTFTNGQTHTVTFADQANGFSFTLDDNGEIHTDSTRVTVSGNTIRLNTAPVNIALNGYNMTFRFNGAYTKGEQTRAMIPAGTGSMDFGSRFTLSLGDQSNGVYLYMDENGDITTGSSRVTASGDTITFNTVPVAIKTSGLSINYQVVGGLYFKGDQTLHLLPAGTSADDFGSIYKINMADQPNATYFYLDTDGNASSDSSRITTDGNQITFHTVPVYVDTGDYTMQYRTAGGYSVGNQTLMLLPAGTGSDDSGDRYTLSLGNRSNNLYFHVLADGSVSADSTRFSFNGNTIQFSGTVAIDVNPVDYDGRFMIANGWTSGRQEVVVMVAGEGSEDQNNMYALVTDQASGSFEVGNPCSIVGGNEVVVGDVTFTLTCPQPILDSDEDGINDDSDNCPAISNPSQLDQDNDGMGDACDTDLDGDMIDNVADNCPDISNSDQQDTDADGLGDACDDDVDGDSINDDQDNCPLISNLGQQDNDFDGLGDACDNDDDNDTIEDSLDNCPLFSNADQLDTDADGEGDVCDGDVDGDGVANSNDMCPATSLGSQVTIEGCDGFEYVSWMCQADQFPNHGRYVSCVTQSAQSMVDAGLLSQKQKAQLVREAARKD